MKRSGLKPYKSIFRKPIKRQSSMGKLLDRADKLFFRVLLKERAARCELCSKTTTLGTFHIFPKSTHSKLRYSKNNVLITCWLPCHYNFHHDPYKARVIIDKIKELKGADFEDTLKAFNATMPNMTRHQIQMYIMAFKQQLGE